MLSHAQDPIESAPVCEPTTSSTVMDFDPNALNLIDAHIGRKIRLRRRVLGLNQTELAHRIGVTFQQVHKYETGRSSVTAARLFAIARALASPPDDFFSDIEV